MPVAVAESVPVSVTSIRQRSTDSVDSTERDFHCDKAVYFDTSWARPRVRPSAPECARLAMPRESGCRRFLCRAERRDLSDEPRLSPELAHSLLKKADRSTWRRVDPRPRQNGTLIAREMWIMRTTVLRPDRQGIFHPGNDEEVADLILMALSSGRQVRVVGAGRSLAETIYPDAFLAGRPFQAVTISLDRMRYIHFDDEHMEVTVGAGCKLAFDPRDRTGSSTPANSVVGNLERRGWALPLLAGGNIQTVGGYLMGGSEGGSLRHSLNDVVVGLRLIDGHGKCHSFRVGDELFDAVGVSLGLLGVVTAVTLRCQPRYDLIGSEVSVPTSTAGVGLVPGQAHRVMEFLRDAEYGRIMWWPQPGLERAVIWQARRMGAADYAATVGPDGELRENPYQELPSILGSTVPVQVAAGLYLTALGRWPRWFHRLVGNSAASRAVATRLREVWRTHLKGRAFGLFVGGDPDKPHHFRDSWWHGLSMDSDMDARILPTDFTELWVPESRADEAVDLLRRHFERGGHDASGNFVTELYGGKCSRFWLSPGYGEDHLRINVFWFKGNAGDPDKHYRQYWDLLEPLGYRLHWSKALPPAKRLGADWFRSRYPHFDDFMAVRQQLDPEQLFVTDYWRARLGIDAPSRRLVPQDGPDPRAEAAAAPRPWPLLFELRRANGSLSGKSSHVFDNTVVISAPIEEVFRVATQPVGGPSWITQYRGTDWLTEPFGEVDSACLETFSFMSARVRVVEVDPPYRCVASIDACTLPLGKEMTSEWSFREVGGGTEVCWQVCYTPAAAARPLHPLLRPFFAWVFRTSAARLKQHLERGMSAQWGLADNRADGREHTARAAS